jgi:hypothetical protein
MVSFATEQDTKKKLATELHGITQEEEKTCQENYTEAARSFSLPFFRVIPWLNLILLLLLRWVFTSPCVGSSSTWNDLHEA